MYEVVDTYYIRVPEFGILHKFNIFLWKIDFKKLVILKNIISIKFGSKNSFPFVKIKYEHDIMHD